MQRQRKYVLICPNTFCLSVFGGFFRISLTACSRDDAIHCVHTHFFTSCDAEAVTVGCVGTELCDVVCSSMVHVYAYVSHVSLV